MAKILERVNNETGVSVSISVQFTDIATIAREVKIPVFAQYIDPIKPGAFTGHVLPEAVKEAGAAGVMLNHKEKPLSLTNLIMAMKRAREVGLLCNVCAGSVEEVDIVARLKPDTIIAEPSELIGTGRAVSRYDKEFVSGVVRTVKQIDPTILLSAGGGISTPEDAGIAISLGMDGAGGASSIMKAKNPYGLLSEMAIAIKNAWNLRHPGQKS
jgi:triosephosphate isomerase